MRNNYLGMNLNGHGINDDGFIAQNNAASQNKISGGSRRINKPNFNKMVSLPYAADDLNEDESNENRIAADLRDERDRARTSSQE